jgi:tetratricopeptide (TPR) repeat protein
MDLSPGKPHGAPPRAARAARGTTPSASDRESLKQARRAFERGDDDDARRRLDRIVESGLRFADVHYMLGLVHERQDDLDAAAASLREAIRINPGYVEALVALASVCERLGDYDQSRGLAERAGQLSRAGDQGLDATTRGKLTNQQAALADALAAAGLRREAIEQYRQALERCPTFHDIRHRLGVTLREAGLPFQALQEFERILDVHPALLESRIQLGLTCYAMGRANDAVRAWRQVLELDPTRREAGMYLRLVAGKASDAGSPALRDAAARAALDGTGTADSSAAGRMGTGWATKPLSAQGAAFADDRSKDVPGNGSDLPSDEASEVDAGLDRALGAIFE